MAVRLSALHAFHGLLTRNIIFLILVHITVRSCVNHGAQCGYAAMYIYEFVCELSFSRFTCFTIKPPVTNWIGTDPCSFSRGSTGDISTSPYRELNPSLNSLSSGKTSMMKWTESWDTHWRGLDMKRRETIKMVFLWRCMAEQVQPVFSVRACMCLLPLIVCVGRGRLKMLMITRILTVVLHQWLHHALTSNPHDVSLFTFSLNRKAMEDHKGKTVYSGVIHWSVSLAYPSPVGHEIFFIP
jgi:hypothetical protein